MSFFSDTNNISPGRIDGSAMNGLQHRVAICAERVLDSALKQEQRENVSLVLSGTAPTAAAPYKFINAHSTTAAATVTNLSIVRLEERPAFARVKCTVVIPLTIKYENHSGEKNEGPSEIKVDEDVIMYVPNASIFPFEIKAQASVNCPNGKFIGSTQNCTVTACITIVTKITATTDLLLPAYGFCPSPRAIEFEKAECSDFFDLPLYPSGEINSNRSGGNGNTNNGNNNMNNNRRR